MARRVTVRQCKHPGKGVALLSRSSALSRASTRHDRHLERYQAVRNQTSELTRPLSPEDATAQSMPDASPAKWHLAHTTWFFETFLLKPFKADYCPFHPAYDYLFNSYYNSIGEQYDRPTRGLVTRPGLAEIHDYRAYVDAAMTEVLEGGGEPEVAELVEIGLHHEQQHQELLVTDVKHLLSLNPMAPVYRARPPSAVQTAEALSWVDFPGGLYSIGEPGSGFAFDNERPRHPVYLPAYRLASRPVTNAEFLAFIDDGGYSNPLLWLADGWDQIAQRRWTAPQYWSFDEHEGWCSFTLSGVRPLDRDEPVTHLSYYEADAFARWYGARLPSEAEWEAAAQTAPVAGNFLDSGRIHPQPGPAGGGLVQLFGDVWEWTASAYGPYPGFQPSAGALGEYNGKFMCNQYVLRGGSCATPQSHIRPTYRNFFYPDARWQFSGLRLARDGRAR